MNAVSPVAGGTFTASPPPHPPSSVPGAFARVLRSIETNERILDRVTRDAFAGRAFSQTELLGIQACVYRYTQEMDLFGRVLERTVSAVRQTLQVQV